MGKNNLDTHSFLVISGPTGVGKTELSYEFASEFPIEIINGDMGQLYGPLSIGTAKPTKQEFERLPHHLFGILEEPTYCSVMQYRQMVKKAMDDIWQRGVIPVVVGGSFFYLKALFLEPQLCEPSTQSDLTHCTNEELWQRLYQVDPNRARALHVNDRYRLERALHIWQTSGKLPSECAPVFKPLGQGCILFVQRERDDLYKRINQRVLVMFEQGWIEEVEKLSYNWKLFLKEKKILGYPEIIEYLKQGSTHEAKKTLIEKIQQKTRNYAKRQTTFWQSFNKELAAFYGKTVGYEVNLAQQGAQQYEEIKKLIRSPKKNG